MGSKQEANGVAGRVHGKLEVFPPAAYLDVGFIHPPALADGAFVLAKGFLESRYQLDHPAMHARMTDLEIPFGHHLFEITEVQPIRYIHRTYSRITSSG
jgi:hypothetical protein